MLLWVPSAYAFEPFTATAALAALAAAAGTAGTGAGIWSMFGGGKKKKQTTGTPGQYDIIYPSQYSFTEPRMRLTSDFISQNIGRMNEGKFPSWYEGISPLLKEQQEKGLRESYYGTGFTPGVLAESKAYDVSRGLGRGAGAGKNYNTQLAKYADASRAIDQYIAELGYNAQREGATTFPTMSMQMPKGPDVLGYNYIPPEAEGPSGMDTLLQTLGSVAPWLLQGMGGQKDWTPQGTSPTDTSWMNNYSTAPTYPTISGIPTVNTMGMTSSVPQSGWDMLSGNVPWTSGPINTISNIKNIGGQYLQNNIPGYDIYSIIKNLMQLGGR